MKNATGNLRGPTMYVRLNAREADTLKSIAANAPADFDLRTITRLVSLGLLTARSASDGTSRLTREGLEWLGRHPVTQSG